MLSLVCRDTWTVADALARVAEYRRHRVLSEVGEAALLARVMADIRYLLPEEAARWKLYQALGGSKSVKYVGSEHVLARLAWKIDRRPGLRIKVPKVVEIRCRRARDVRFEA